MSDFADVAQFAREHARCGGLTPKASSRPGLEGYHLEITCACGATHDRWVTAEEARQPLPRPSEVPQPAARLQAGPAVAQAPAAVTPGPASSVPVLNSTHAWPARAPAPARVEASVPVARSGSRGRIVWVVLLLLVVGAAAAGTYVAGVPDVDRLEPTLRRWWAQLTGPGTPPPSAPPKTPPPAAVPPPATDAIAGALRELQASITPSVALNDYASRVATTRVEVERRLAGAPEPARAEAQAALDVHRLAVSAWRGRTIDQRDEWERIGQDVAVELCPAVKRAVEAAAPARGVTRAQARGVAVAASLPQLWECAAEKTAALASRPAAPAVRPSGA